MAADIGVETQVDTDNKHDPEYNCDNNSPGGVGLGGPVVRLGSNSLIVVVYLSTEITQSMCASCDSCELFTLGYYRSETGSFFFN